MNGKEMRSRRKRNISSSVTAQSSADRIISRLLEISFNQESSNVKVSEQEYEMCLEISKSMTTQNLHISGVCFRGWQ
jgi:hypothetical protein